MRAETQLNVAPVRMKKIIHKPVMKIFYKFFNGFLYIGTKNKEYYKHIGRPESKLFLVPYSFNNDFFISKVEAAKKNINEIKNKFNLNNNNLNIIYASKLIKRKNPINLLKAFELLKKNLENINLIFVGTGEEEENLKNFVRENRIDNVYFLGFLNQSELPKALAISDIFVLPFN